MMSSSASMAPAVVVRGAGDADRACAPGLPVTLLSAAGAALYAGCGWWRALVNQARARHPGVIAADIFDCGDAPGLALAALRIGQQALVLDPGCSGFSVVAAVASARGAILLAARPAAFCLRTGWSDGRLTVWLRAPVSGGG
jgi:hypothetical protein